VAQSEVREQEIERLKRLTTEQAREMALQCEMMHRLQNANDRCVCVRERERERESERERENEMMHRLQNAHDRCVCVCVCV